MGNPKGLVTGQSKSVDAVDAIAWRVVALIGVLNLFRGSIHTFLPDGGAGVIAGFDLGPWRQTIVFLFAVMGIEQLSLGVVDLIVAFGARWLALPMLWFHTLEQTAAEIVFVFLQTCARASARHSRLAVDGHAAVAGTRMDLLAAIERRARNSERASSALRRVRQDRGRSSPCESEGAGKIAIVAMVVVATVGWALFRRYWYYIPGLVAQHHESDPAQSPGDLG